MMRIGHEVTADERDALAVALGRAVRIGERLTAEDVAALRGMAEAPPPATRRVPRRPKP